MKDLATLIIMLIYLYSSGIDISNPVFMQNLMYKFQTEGFKTTVNNFENNLPTLLSQSGIEIPEELNEILPGFPVKIPEKLDYIAELKKLGYYKNEDKNDRNVKSKDMEAVMLRNAVLRFQSSSNITVTGKWDENCLEKLVQRLILGKDICKDTIGTPPSSSKWIVINKTKRILTLYDNTTIVKKYPIAIGNPPSLTPEGKFTIGSKVINPAWGGGGYAKPVKGGVPENPLGYRWLGILYKGNSSSIGIHGNNSPFSIGTNVSHGCIRMINSDVEELFKIVNISTPVWIGTDSKLREWGIIQDTIN